MPSAPLPPFIALVPLPKAVRLLNHGPTVLVSARSGGRQNVMAAAWACVLDFDKLSVVIDKGAATRALIEESGHFVIQVPTAAQAPLVAGCSAWLACRVLPEKRNELLYDLFMGEITAAWADERAFRQGRWQFESAPEWRSLHYVAGGQFYATGASIQTEPVDDSD